MSDGLFPDDADHPYFSLDRDDDLVSLAEFLQVPPHALLVAAGGPWRTVPRMVRGSFSSAVRSGSLLLGRGGPSVGLQISDDRTSITVGMAIGTWKGPGHLEWRVDEPGIVIALPPVVEDRADLLEQLRQACDAATAAKRPTLFTCRYCGELVAPEHGSIDSECCYGCGASVFGCVY